MFSAEFVFKKIIEKKGYKDVQFRVGKELDFGKGLFITGGVVTNKDNLSFCQGLDFLSLC